MAERYTNDEWLQYITQADWNVFGYLYVASYSSVNSPSAFLDEESDHSAVGFFQGKGLFLAPGVST